MRGIEGRGMSRMGRMGGIGGMRRIRVVDRKVTLVALRSFLFGDWGWWVWFGLKIFLIFLKIFFENFFEVRPCRSIFWTILLRLFFFYYSHMSRYL